jgi:His-Xaa-Ser system protein HxsD
MKLPGIPEALASADLEEGSVHVVLDEGVYPLEAIYGASFVFIDRAFVFVDRPSANRYRVVLTPKKGAFDADALRALAGELANELLANAWRHQITKENRATIEAVTMQAIAGAMGPPSLDDLEDFDFSEEPFDDPLGIAQSWEEKYQKKKPGTEGDPE